ncbi:hypothetical protein [Pseudoalteromonas sp. S16_S37]|uniref:hypothetical protein n=1 Tax=Pseudoalteromonas sp. S16_S37 TaxID=2720228 RepID=UPI00168165CC|nr:hypothetical protein [Pseudoalteromonas sp. S16_S37]MBD1583449.1 hypothetical protein [Pseudoalteromonas sp. S16_S37]
MELNELLHHIGWYLKGYEFLIVFWFVVAYFPTCKWSLFTASGKNLNSLHLHEMHSCFITALCILMFHIIGSELEAFFTGPFLAQLDDKIRVFYLVVLINQFIFLSAVFCIHRIRYIQFSLVTRFNLYTTLIVMAVMMMQLIARGYFDYHELKPAYKIVFWSCNIASIIAISIYPIRHTLAHFKKASLG